MSHSSNKNINRRNFLSLFGATTALPLMQSPVQILIESILIGTAQKAHAEVFNYSPRKFLQILQNGAPSRWTYDLFLTPYDSTYVRNPYLGTKFTGSSTYTDTEYATVLKKGLNVPYLWQFNVPHANGSQRPMDQLLDNMVSLRGINVGNADHGAAQELQFLPLGAGHSMSALSADYSKAPIPAINCGNGQYRFKSEKSKSFVALQSGGNLLTKLLNPFSRTTTNSDFNTRRQSLGTALDAAIEILNTTSENKHSGLSNTSSSLNAAKDLLSKGFGDLNSTWNNLVAKYSLLISRSFDPNQNLIGINDKVVGGTDTRNRRYALNSDTNLVLDADLRTMINLTTRIGQMAENFAMAEYVLTNNLSSSISIALGSINNLKIAGVQNSGQGLAFDEHEAGCMPTQYVNSFYNLAYSACLLELIDQLKLKNIFSETVIVTGGEFGRNPRKDGFGSDHGFTGSSSAIYSGAITSPVVLGNIFKDKTPTAAYSGTWGQGAPVAEIGRELDLGHWASTIAFLLRVPTPVTASTSVLSLKNGIITPIIEKAKQV